MDQPRKMRLYLEPRLQASALAGQHNFIRLMMDVLARAGFETQILPTGLVARARAPALPGYALFHMEPPTHDRALTFRRVYHYPFWAIEPVAERGNWYVSTLTFPAGKVNRAAADTFHQRWQKRLFGAAAQQVTRDGFVYVPLQGRLQSQRSFQRCSPLEMIERTLAGDPIRKIFATLHPGETYTDDEHAALSRLSARFPRFQLVRRSMQDCLQACDYVVSQNSSAAFNGVFFRKPALLFADIDFHHITLGPDGFDRIATHAPDYAGYVWWFWQHNCINAGHETAQGKIAQAFRRAGVPL